MRVYLAGIYATQFHRTGAAYCRLNAVERRHRDAITDILESFHYLKDEHVANLRRDGARVFLDSGAFSAYTQGVCIDLDAYCRFIREHTDIIAEEEGQPLYSVLDSIGDPEQTLRNQWAMEQLGLRPIPCFHYGEDERYLLQYLDSYLYIALGGMVGRPRPHLSAWLARIWNRYLLGRPGLRVHGFGLTSEDVMRRYPWHSMDSTSWVMVAATGNLFVPGLGTVSVRRLGGSVLRIAAVQGFDAARLRRDYASRWAFNCWSYSELGRRMNQT